MSARTARPLAAVSGLVLTGLALAGGAPAAYAAPGDDGDVKIHKVGTPFDDQRNEPKVCRFYLAAFNFDKDQKVQWEIVPQPDKADDPNLGGQLTLPTGTGHTGPLALPDGMYKLTWTFEGENGAGKQKVFQVDCPNGGGPGGPGGNGGHGHHPHGPVGAGGGGSAEIAAQEDASAFGVGAAVAAGLAGTVGLVLIRRSRRRNDGAA
ncbi:hypothetical protein ACFFSH_21010 [Streptomyces filamentosus]|uniref:Gram-positive cocci surface proteins LPxTG domain-containing protein n=1 Tax=Streptomyces filamentosus TaxID=67294 RepID=A0A919BUV4_STRFL|nr:hypothetical protein [Streptomyces filamentosus]KAA6216856.1 hypothetical protein CP979_07825 [Streptomyces filamentosus]GHG19532.1 hypothetical protein GCM10017667_63050 [Streptomyces filamentosus]